MIEMFPKSKERFFPSMNKRLAVKHRWCIRYVFWMQRNLFLHSSTFPYLPTISVKCRKKNLSMFVKIWSFHFDRTFINISIFFLNLTKRNIKEWVRKCKWWWISHEKRKCLITRWHNCCVALWKQNKTFIKTCLLGI